MRKKVKKVYQTSPMENFNKNNPFIIIAKRTYDTIFDTIQEFGKTCIKATILNVSVWIILVTAYVYLMITKPSEIIGAILMIVFTAVVNVVSIYSYRKRIAYFITMHHTMKEFERLSNLQVNDILSLNNEDILKCINGLHSLYGELTATVRYYHLLMPAYTLIQTWLIIYAFLR